MDTIGIEVEIDVSGMEGKIIASSLLDKVGHVALAAASGINAEIHITQLEFLLIVVAKPYLNKGSCHCSSPIAGEASTGALGTTLVFRTPRLDLATQCVGGERAVRPCVVPEHERPISEPPLGVFLVYNAMIAMRRRRVPPLAEPPQQEGEARVGQNLACRMDGQEGEFIIIIIREFDSPARTDFD